MHRLPLGKKREEAQPQAQPAAMPPETGRVPPVRPPRERLGMRDRPGMPGGPPRPSPASAQPPAPAPRKKLVRWRKPVMLTVAVYLAFALLLAYTARQAFQPRLSDTEIKALAAQVMASATPPPSIAARVYAAVQPSLVLVRTDETREGEVGQALGTGVILDAGGAILTSLHVVEGRGQDRGCVLRRHCIARRNRRVSAG